MKFQNNPRWQSYVHYILQGVIVPFHTLACYIHFKYLLIWHPCCPEVLSIVLSKFPFRRCAEVSFWNFANIKLGKLREVLTNRINLSPTNTLNFSSLKVKLRLTSKSKQKFWLVWNIMFKLRAGGGGGGHTEKCMV